MGPVLERTWAKRRAAQRNDCDRGAARGAGLQGLVAAPRGRVGPSEGVDPGAVPHGLCDSLSLAEVRFLLVPVCSLTKGLSKLMNQSASHSAYCKGPR